MASVATLPNKTNGNGIGIGSKGSNGDGRQAKKVIVVK